MINWYIVQTFSGFEQKIADTLKDMIQKKKLEEQISEVLVDLSQFLSSQNINFSVLEGNLSDLAASKDLDSEILHKAILVMLVNMDLNQSLKKTLQSFRILESEKSNSIDLTKKLLSRTLLKTFPI